MSVRVETSLHLPLASATLPREFSYLLLIVMFGLVEGPF